MAYMNTYTKTHTQTHTTTEHLVIHPNLCSPSFILDTTYHFNLSIQVFLLVWTLVDPLEKDYWQDERDIVITCEGDHTDTFLAIQWVYLVTLFSLFISLCLNRKRMVTASVLRVVKLLLFSSPPPLSLSCPATLTVSMTSGYEPNITDLSLSCHADRVE